jgi:hypothetical protein
MLPPNWYLMRSICQRFGSVARRGFQGRWYGLSGKHQIIESESSVLWRSLYQFGHPLEAERQNLFVYILEFLFHFCRIGVKARSGAAG